MSVSLSVFYPFSTRALRAGSERGLGLSIKSSPQPRSNASPPPPLQGSGKLPLPGMVNLADILADLDDEKQDEISEEEK